MIHNHTKQHIDRNTQTGEKYVRHEKYQVQGNNRGSISGNNERQVCLFFLFASKNKRIM